jgi:hypothetical protein
MMLSSCVSALFGGGHWNDYAALESIIAKLVFVRLATGFITTSLTAFVRAFGGKSGGSRKWSLLTTGWILEALEALSRAYFRRVERKTKDLCVEGGMGGLEQSAFS